MEDLGMLNVIRQKREQLKWVLWPVIIALGAGMVFLFVATPPGRNTTGDMGNNVAVVGDEDIPMQSYQANLLNMLNYLGPEARQNPATLRQYGGMILSQMVRNSVFSQEARRMGLKVSEEEIRDFILKSPLFTENGTFIGMKEYEARLRNLGNTPETYEREIATILLVRKVQELVSGGASVSDSEIRNYFEEHNDKAKIKFAFVPFYNYLGKVQPTEDQLKAYHKANSERYRISETRQVKYVVLEVTKLQNALLKSIPENEIKAEYESRKAEYPDETMAAHILLKFPKDAKPEDEAKVKATAEGILAEVQKPGADFAALAKKYSEDTGSAPRGGLLPFFGRGMMVPEFEKAAFALKEGEISPLVRTQYGYHIIKGLGQHNFQSYYRGIVTGDLARQKADRQIKAQAESALTRLQQGAPMETVAREFNSKVELSKPFNTEQTDFTLGNPKGMVEDVFTLKANEYGKVYESYRGYLIPQLIKVIPGHIQTLDEARAKVTNDFRRDEAARLARADASRLLAEARSANDLEKAAKAINAPVETSGQFNRFDPVSPQLGRSPELSASVFARNVNDFAGPVDTKDGVVVFQVLERVRPDASKLPAEKTQIAQNLLNQKKENLVNSYFQNVYRRLQQDKKIRINEPLVENLLRR